VLPQAQPRQGARQFHDAESLECRGFVRVNHGHGDLGGFRQRQLRGGTRSKRRNRQQGDAKEDYQAGALQVVAFGHNGSDEQAQSDDHADGREMI